MTDHDDAPGADVYRLRVSDHVEMPSGAGIAILAADVPLVFRCRDRAGVWRAVDLRDWWLPLGDTGLEVRLKTFDVIGSQGVEVWVRERILAAGLKQEQP